MSKRKQNSRSKSISNESGQRKTKTNQKSPRDPPEKKDERDANQSDITSFFKPKNDQEDAQKSGPKSEKENNLKTSDTIVIQSDSELSYYSETEEEKIRKNPISKKSPREMPNLMFYLNMIQSRPQGDYIDVIHKTWKGDYKKLEIHHGYVQWLFPNFYGSNFNKDAFKLSSEEAKIFRNNLEVAEKLIMSYELILDFFGIVLLDKSTGKLGRSEIYEKRYHETLITSTHNHLRVRRILAHLNITGFRRYAIEFVDFLEKEMFGEIGGYQNFLDQREITAEYRRNLKQNPLYHVIKHNAFKDWRVLGKAETKEELEKLYGMCIVTSDSDLDESVYFRDGKNKK